MGAKRRRWATSPTARQGLLDLLTLFAFDPEYPSRCFRHGYADQRDLLAATYLGGSWEAASPAGKRLYARQMELAFERYRQWTKARSPDTPPEDAAVIEAGLSRVDGYEAGLLAQRHVLAETFYGSRVLTMTDGRRFARAVDECVAALADRVATRRLGRLGDALRKLREDEAGLV